MLTQTITFPKKSGINLEKECRTYMQDCCSSHPKKDSDAGSSQKDKEPRSFIGKYLYNLGKKDFEKNGSKKKSCC